MAIPEKYIDLMILGMLGKFFDDVYMKYLSEVQRHRLNDGTTHKQEINYNLGGYSQDV